MGLAGTLAASACAVALGLVLAPGAGAGVTPTIDPVATQVGGSFTNPVHVTGAPGYDDLVFVTERGGTVRIIQNGNQLPEPFLDITDDITAGGEQGLLSIAFPPDYAESGLFYTYFTNKDCNGNTGGCNIEVAEFKRRNQSSLDARETSWRTVIEIPHQDAGNHNGGTAAFGPDRKLWIATGDGGSGGDAFDNARKLNELLGKLLRINPKEPRTGRLGYRVPQEQPLRRREGPRRDLVDRPAQPVPLLVRRRQHRDRRRGAERARGDRHRPDRDRQGRRLPVAGQGRLQRVRPGPSDIAAADRAGP